MEPTSRSHPIGLQSIRIFVSGAQSWLFPVCVWFAWKSRETVQKTIFARFFNLEPGRRKHTTNPHNTLTHTTNSHNKLAQQNRHNTLTQHIDTQHTHTTNSHTTNWHNPAQGISFNHTCPPESVKTMCQFELGFTTMGWLRLVGFLKLQVSFAKEPFKGHYILQKRPIILWSLLIVATP